MAYKRLYILVEGADDQRFFESVIKVHFAGRYDEIKPVCYARWSSKKLRSFLNSVRSPKMQADYLYVTDINDSPCVERKKYKIREQNIGLEDERIVIVIKEIESWYLAGLTEDESEKLKVRSMSQANNITKERFNELTPKRFDSRIDFMVELLKRYSLSMAREKNRSLDYFCRKFLEG